MTASLPSYDLSQLFHHNPATTKDSAGESLIEDNSEALNVSLDSDLSADKKQIMTDSLSTVSWSEDLDDHIADVEDAE